MQMFQDVSAVYPGQMTDVEVYCDDDSGRPLYCPEKDWPVRGKLYTVIRLAIFTEPTPPYRLSQWVILAELPTNRKNYEEGYEAWRFKPVETLGTDDFFKK